MSALPNTQITDEASEWFVTLRYDNPDAVTQDRFMAWLRQSPEHVRAYLGVTALWTDLPAVGAKQSLDTAALTALLQDEDKVLLIGEKDAIAGPNAQKTPWAVQWPMALAAAIACLILTAGILLYVQWNRSTIYSTNVGEQRSMTLDDGSRVDLNSRSRIRVNFSKYERNIDLLEGQALFHVAKDAARPFWVRSDTAQIRALGTRFDVYRKRNKTIVTVVEGLVAVSSSQSDSSGAARLSAGQQVTVSAQTPLPRPTQANAIAATAWTEGQLMFKSTPLSTVVEEFNRYNNRRMVLALRDTSEDFPITAVFSSADPAMLIEFLKEQPGFTVKVSGDQIQIIQTVPGS